MKSAGEIAVQREKNKAGRLNNDRRPVLHFLKRYEKEIEKSLLNQGRYLGIFSTFELGPSLLQGLLSHLKGLGYVVECHSDRAEDSISLSIMLA